MFRIRLRNQQLSRSAFPKQWQMHRLSSADDTTGSLIKSVDIRERGNGKINVYANDLSAGVYSYSLVADGKIVVKK